MLARERGEYTLVRKRLEIVFLLFLAFIGILALRLMWVQWVQGRAFQVVAAKMQGRDLPIDAPRGSIKDRNGEELAQDILGKSIIVNPRVVRDKAATAARIAEILGLPEKDRDWLR